MKKFKISEIKEQGIWVFCSTQEEADKIRFEFTAINNGCIGSYKFDGGSMYKHQWQAYKRNDSVLFSQIDWEERKQIGWELKKDCKQYREAALKICGITHFLIHNDNGFFTSCKEEELLRKAGVLELWFEPVYEEVKFKVGDKIISDRDESFLKKGLLATVVEVTNSRLTFSHDAESKDYTPLDNHRFRQATAEEIKAAEKIEIGNYPVGFKNGTTTISGYEFTKEFWEAALIVSKHQKAKIKIGCSHQFDLPTETIERILSKLK